MKKDDKLWGFVCVVDGKVYRGVAAINKFSDLFHEEHEKSESYMKTRTNANSATPLFKIKKPPFDNYRENMKGPKWKRERFLQALLL